MKIFQAKTRLSLLPKNLTVITLMLIMSVLPVFSESGELKRNDIQALYTKLQNTVVIPLNPQDIKYIRDYKIKDARQHLQSVSELFNKVNNLLVKPPDDIKKYNILLIMKDILLLNTENIEHFIGGTLDMRRFRNWYYLHNKWIAELENWCSKL